jgi:predicted Ser/Thr protein kinase
MHMKKQRGKETEFAFKRLLIDSGYSEKAANELWKWYDPTNKKGVASF